MTNYCCDTLTQSITWVVGYMALGPGGIYQATAVLSMRYIGAEGNTPSTSFIEVVSYTFPSTLKIISVSVHSAANVWNSELKSIFSFGEGYDAPGRTCTLSVHTVPQR